MVWAGFCSSGKLELAFTSCKMNSKNYTDILASRLIPFIRMFRRKKFIFQQDNAAIHTSEATSAWFKHHKVDVLDWPARSPDSNPVENLWGILVRRIYAEGRQYTSVDELKDAISHAWEEVEELTIKNLIGSMPNRIFQTINRNGRVTDY